jgi:hypothetical protein
LHLTDGRAVRVALLPLPPGEGVSEKMGQAVGAALAGELRRVPGVQVLTASELEAVLSVERQKALLGCESQACVAEIAGALDVERLVLGSFSQMGQSWMLELQLVDGRSATTLTHASRRKKGGSIDDLLDELPSMAQELFGAQAARLG